MSFEQAETAETDQLLPRRELTDPRTMRALAHPVRLDILQALMREGPLTATQAGELLGLSPAACSFHLRQLAKYGFITEAGGGRGRERPWRAVSLTHWWSELSPDRETSAAAATLTALVVERDIAKLASWLERRGGEPAAWQDAALVSNWLLYLTVDELAELNRQVLDLFQPYLERIADPSRRPADARPVQSMAYAFPVPATPSGH